MANLKDQFSQEVGQRGTFLQDHDNSRVLKSYAFNVILRKTHYCIGKGFLIIYLWTTGQARRVRSKYVQTGYGLVFHYFCNGDIFIQMLLGNFETSLKETWVLRIQVFTRKSDGPVD